MSTSSRHRIAIIGSYPIWDLITSLNVGHQRGAVWLVTLSELFQKSEEFELHWICLNRHAARHQCIQHGNQFFHVVPGARKLIGLYTGYIHDRWLVSRVLREIKPDLVHSWGTENCYAICGKSFPGKKILSIQGLLRACIARAPMSAYERRHSLYEKGTIEAFKWITTESPMAAGWVRELVPAASPMHLEYAVAKEFQNIPRVLSSRPTCLFGGTDTPVKNINTLIKAFSQPELSHIHLKMAGPSPSIRTALPRNITALGFVSREEMAKLLSEAWCLVHPSLADTGPTIVKEARVMGLPVVLSDQCGSQQHVIEGKSGFIHSPFDTEKLIRSILTVTQSAETSLQMGNYGLEECRRALSKETMYERLSTIYRAVLDGRDPASI
ncbi:MAG: glycosyltransferase family 4 protein [Akkermansia sp.]|nr:glycosyltransferase family 4 protein [Akkermansia sp.]